MRQVATNLTTFLLAYNLQDTIETTDGILEGKAVAVDSYDISSILYAFHFSRKSARYFVGQFHGYQFVTDFRHQRSRNRVTERKYQIVSRNKVVKQ